MSYSASVCERRKVADVKISEEKVLPGYNKLCVLSESLGNVNVVF